MYTPEGAPAFPLSSVLAGAEVGVRQGVAWGKVVAYVGWMVDVWVGDGDGVAVGVTGTSNSWPV